MTEQDAYNRQMQESFAATRRVEAKSPSPERDVVRDLQELASLHASGFLTDAEFEASKAKVLNAEGPS